MNLPFNNDTLPEMLAILENSKKGNPPEWLSRVKYDVINNTREPRIIADFTYKDWQIKLRIMECISWHFTMILPTGRKFECFTDSPKDPFKQMGDGFTKRFYDHLDKNIEFLNKTYIFQNNNTIV